MNSDPLLPMQRGITMIWAISKMFPYCSDHDWGELFWQYCSCLMNWMVSIMYKFERLCVCPLWEFKDGNICPQSPWFTEVPLSVGLVQWLIIHSLKGWLVRKTEFPFPENQKKSKYKRIWVVDLVSFSTRSCKKGKVVLWAFIVSLHSAQMDDFSA